ncbi:MAG: hypothetical protein U0414_19830 [Polyangiaceae bacterium]
MKRPTRRSILKGLGAAFGAAALSRGARGDDQKPSFLIVLGGAGGASIIDSFLAIRASESANPSTLNVFPDASVVSIPGSPLRAVDTSASSIGPIPFPYSTSQSAFVAKHHDDMLVATITGTSVNHTVAQERSRTGNGAWLGRTLEECVANQFGASNALPNVNMATGGFAARGRDSTLPLSVFGAPVATPTLWPFGLDGVRGVMGAPSADLVGRARALRDKKLEPGTSFMRAFGDGEAISLWRQQRTDSVAKLEGSDLIEKLNLLPDTAATPLSHYGLQSSPDAAALAATFTNLGTDELEAQAALAYLLLKNRVSSAVTIAPSFSVLLGGGGILNPPLAFDFSHTANRATQAIMWNRLLGIADKLIGLLKNAPLDATSAESLWDRTLIYVATDFGRTKTRPADAAEFGAGHDLNNGVLILSPLVKGNRVLGGVNPDTGLTYGFDPVTGAPDLGRTTSEAELFAGILDALGVDTTGSGLPSVTAFRG